MPIYKKTDVLPKRPVIVLVYGTPGAGKTSVANTANNPLLIDCDRGCDRSINRCDTLVASKWEDIISEVSSFKDYKTIILDTAKAALDDFLSVYVCGLNYKLKNNKLKMYGEIGDQFKAFISDRRAEDVDIVIIAHSKEDKDGDVIKVSPDVTGQSKDLLLRIADQVGYLTMVNNQRTIVWSPTDTSVGKNVAQLEPTIIPNVDADGFSTCMADIIEKTKTSIQSMSQSQVDSLKKLEEVKGMIDGLKDADGANIILTEIQTLSAIQKNQVRNLFAKKADELELVFNKDTKQYEDKPKAKK